MAAGHRREARADFEGDSKSSSIPTTLAQFYGLLASNTAVTLPDYFMMNSRRHHVYVATCLPKAVSNVSRGIVCKTGPGVHVQRESPRCGAAVFRS